MHCVSFDGQLSVAPSVEDTSWQISSSPSPFLEMRSLLTVKEILMAHDPYKSLCSWLGYALDKVSKNIPGFRSLCGKVGTGEQKEIR